MKKTSILVQFLILGSLFGTLYFSCQGPNALKGIKFDPKSGGLSESASIDSGTCGPEDNCLCSVEVNHIIDGEPYDAGVFARASYGTPLNVLQGAGSENIPVTCETGAYLSTGRYNWFNDYFDVQKRSDVGWGGTEMFSPGYYSQTVGYLLVVLNNAIQRGHSDLEAKAAEWLKAYWAFLALTANQDPTTGAYYTLVGDSTPNSIVGNGYGLSIMGSRAYVSNKPGPGFQHLYLSVALDHPFRDIGYNLNGSPGAYGGFRGFLRKVGYGISSTGKINLRSKSVTARQVGLTDTERATLRDFISSRGTQNLSAVLDMIRPWGTTCSATFLRTSEGIISWFGTSNTTSNSCSIAKGGPQSAMRFRYSDRRTDALVRVRYDKNPTAVEVWREGQKICARSVELPQECLDIPGGQVNYEVSVTRSGISCVTGACSGGTPPNPTPTTTLTQTPPTTQGGGQPPNPGPLPQNLAAEPPPPGACTDGITLCLMRGRFKVTASWYNQWIQTSGVARPVKFTDIVGHYAFSSDPNDIQIVVKVNDFGTKQLIYFSELTKTMFKIKINDTQTGLTKIYQNTNGDCGGTDPDFNGTAALISGGPQATVTALGQTQNPGVKCVPASDTLCFMNNRYKIKLSHWRNQYNNVTGTGKARPLSAYAGGNYFSADSTDINVFYKLLQFPTANLFFYGSLTNFEYKFQLTDTNTGKSLEFSNPAGTQCGGFIGDLLTSEYLQ